MPTEQIGLWLTPGTIAALKTEARRRGVKYSELAEELIGRGLAADTAARLEERAVPLFAGAVQGVVVAQLRGFERRLARRLVALERSAGMAARIGYTHLYRDHPDEAEGDWQQASEELELALRESSAPLPTDEPTRAVTG